MKAAYYKPSPDGGVVEFDDAPKPEPGPDEVLVRVKATGLNRGEVVRRRGYTSGEPVISGAELAGEVVENGPGAGDFSPGDRVMGQVAGCNAEFVVANQGLLARIPDHLDWVQAAALPNSLVTAHDAIISNGELQPGESVLINAGSSGVGVAAIQIAKAMGAERVIATSRSAEKLPALIALGADVVIDLSSQSSTDAVAAATVGAGVDLIIDSVGAADFSDNMKNLAIQGRLIGVGRLGGAMAEIDLNQIAFKRIRIIGVTFRTRSPAEKIACSRACYADLAGPMRDGIIKPLVDRVFPLEELDAAHGYMESNAQTGKIVMTL